MEDRGGDRAINAIKQRMEGVKAFKDLAGRNSNNPLDLIGDALNGSTIARSEELVVPEALDKLKEKIDKVRGAIFRDGKPLSPGDLRTFIALVPNFSLQASPEYNEDTDSSRLIALSEGESVIRFFTLGFDGKYAIELEFKDKKTPDYFYDGASLEEMTTEEYTIVNDLLTDTTKGIGLSI